MILLEDEAMIFQPIDQCPYNLRAQDPQISALETALTYRPILDTRMLISCRQALQQTLTAMLSSPSRDWLQATGALRHCCGSIPIASMPKVSQLCSCVVALPLLEAQCLPVRSNHSRLQRPFMFFLGRASNHP